jgi:hypothetical protein
MCRSLKAVFDGFALCFDRNVFYALFEQEQSLAVAYRLTCR